MDHLALKLVLTPLLIGAASLAGRRWGPGVGGWLVGLPLTSGPIAFFIALRDGVSFAGAAAVGILAGTISQAAFSVAYGWLAARAVLRGLLMGLFAFTAFFWVLAVILEPWGVGAGFAAASGVALAVQGASLWLIRRGER